MQRQKWATLADFSWNFVTFPIFRRQKIFHSRAKVTPPPNSIPERYIWSAGGKTQPPKPPRLRRAPTLPSTSTDLWWASSSSSIEFNRSLHSLMSFSYFIEFSRSPWRSIKLWWDLQLFNVTTEHNRAIFNSIEYCCTPYSRTSPCRALESFTKIQQRTLIPTKHLNSPLNVYSHKLQKAMKPSCGSFISESGIL